MTNPVRVRFAPSPTGEPHVGNIRTAVFAWLFARAHEGTFLIRIEDTDRARFVPGAVESILASLTWLGIDWDEGPDIGGPYEPYSQSERKDRGDYQIAINRLLSSGHAYYCFCSSERLKTIRELQRSAGKPPGYDRRCRTLAADDLATEMNDSIEPVVRFAMPTEGRTVVSDIIRGKVTFENALLDDFVILKSDKYPTYHLANVVDDHAMEISHVIRAEEWLPSLPRHWKLYEALGFERPFFAHVPVILAPDRSKLSKRHGATSISEFRKNGYLPAAMVNFLSLLGWSLDDKSEIFSIGALIGNFSIERVSKSPAIFNVEKLDWMNGLYIRESNTRDLVDTLNEYWKYSSDPQFDREPDGETLTRIIPLIQERIKNLSDAAALIRFFFASDLKYESGELIQKKMDVTGSLAALERTATTLKQTKPFGAASIENDLRGLADELNIKPGQLFGSLRIATTGQRVSPPLFESIEVLGKELTLHYIQNAIRKLSSLESEDRCDSA